VPSALLGAGDVVSIADRAKAQLRIVDALQLAEKVGFPAWVEVDAKKMNVRSRVAPERNRLRPGHQREPRRRAVQQVKPGEGRPRREAALRPTFPLDVFRKRVPQCKATHC